MYCPKACELIQPFWRLIEQFLLKFKMYLIFNSLIPLLGIYLTLIFTGLYKNIDKDVNCNIAHNSKTLDKA